MTFECNQNIVTEDFNFKKTDIESNKIIPNLSTILAMPYFQMDRY